MAPQFGLDDGANSSFDATLVLATMLTSQLRRGDPFESDQAAGAASGQNMNGTGSRTQQERCKPNASEHPSDHTRIWSNLSGINFYASNNFPTAELYTTSTILQEVH